MRLSLGILIFMACSIYASASSRPNIVVIVADDLGYADMAFLPQAPDDVKHFGSKR